MYALPLPHPAACFALPAPDAIRGLPAAPSPPLFAVAHSVHRIRAADAAVTGAPSSLALAVTSERSATGLNAGACTARPCAAGTCARRPADRRNMCGGARALRERTGPRTGSGARCVKTAAGRLHRAPRFVTSVAGTTTRNAHGDRGSVVSLNRRDGSNPMRRRRFKPETVCRATLPLSTPVGVDIVTPDAPIGAELLEGSGVRRATPEPSVLRRSLMGTCPCFG